ncbi:MAG: DoxX family protein [Bacteroidales bacterium]|nr:DoxX family protein [Bacteroidales bacterium]
MPFYRSGFPKVNFLMTFLEILIVISGLSFLVYGINYFISPAMKSEFKRFGLEKFGLLTAVLEISGALGLFVGFMIHPILLISSGGLALLMFFGVIARLRVKDSLWISLPAVFFMLLNSYVFFESMKFFLD